MLGAATPPSGADDLLKTFRSVASLRAKFHEEKHMAILAAPLTTEGELYFAAPDRLTRRVTAPSPSTALIEGGRLSFSDGHGSQSISLGDNPVARAFVESFVEILSGDAQGLARTYDLAVTRNGKGWSMQLTPKAAPLNQVLASLELSGSGAVVDRMRLREVGGDETVTTFSAVELGRPFSPDELHRLFTLDPK